MFATPAVATNPSDWSIGPGTNSAFKAVNRLTGKTYDDSSMATINAVIAAAQTAYVGVRVEENSVGNLCSTKLIFDKTKASFGAVTGTLAVGKLIYTFPPGEILVTAASMNLGLYGVANAANTPDTGLGTTIGSGANATLNLVDSGNGENILTGQQMNDCAGVREVITLSLDTNLVIATAGAHTVYLNTACAWTGNTLAGATTIDGFVVINWTYMS